MASGPRTPPRGDGMAAVFVDTMKSAEVFRRIDELREYGWQDSFVQCLPVLGEPRSGKTRMLKRYATTRFPEWDPDSQEVGPVVMFEIPAHANTKSAATALLSRLNDPSPSYGSVPDQMDRAADAMRGRVELIIIDEVQRLIDADTEKVLKKVSGWVTDLQNRKVAPVVLVGEVKARLVLSSSGYIEGRSRGVVTVGPYDWGDTAMRNEFRAFLYNLEAGLGLTVAGGLSSLSMALLIHQYARGLIGMAARLIGYARTVAARSGSPVLLPFHFEQACDELMVTEAYEGSNPFKTARLAAEGK